jgi:hypothetical protein
MLISSSYRARQGSHRRGRRPSHRQLEPLWRSLATVSFGRGVERRGGRRRGRLGFRGGRSRKPDRDVAVDSPVSQSLVHKPKNARVAQSPRKKYNEKRRKTRKKWYLGTRRRRLARQQTLDRPLHLVVSLLLLRRWASCLLWKKKSQDEKAEEEEESKTHW